MTTNKNNGKGIVFEYMVNIATSPSCIMVNTHTLSQISEEIRNDNHWMSCDHLRDNLLIKPTDKGMLLMDKELNVLDTINLDSPKFSSFDQLEDYLNFS